MENELNPVSLSTWSSITTLSMPLNEDKARGDMLPINYTKWIKVCKNDFYGKLEKMLSIKMSSVTIKELLDRMYSIENFSNQRHDAMMKAIDREVRFKNKVEPLKFSVNDSEHSYYAMEVSIENFKIFLEEILEEPLTEDFDEPALNKIVWITKLKWITICKNEWYDEIERVLNFDRDGLKALDSFVNQLYSTDVFTDDRHAMIMKAINRELKFKQRVEVIKVYPTESYS